MHSKRIRKHRTCKDRIGFVSVLTVEGGCFSVGLRVVFLQVIAAEYVVTTFSIFDP